ncbi:mechanosensitive ion channel domain-containing protein [Halonotius roseus]|uniref:Mechanosensitive ion channel n=1 Tax=Halonotius roseus TaxID=2511997 RepID=A0A544QLN2_9EURY|nr:mechanosensitive ion channel domain-containing protein [Halonotius roseus]TQQ79506.1 mechanosensitive ion channel [Halonotius roseus]
MSALQFAVPEWLAVVSPRWWIAVGIVLLGIGLGYLTMRLGRRLLHRLGINEAVEGTAVERAAGEYGTSTVGLLTKLAGYFVILLSVFIAGTFTNIQFADLFLRAAAVFLPQLAVALLILVVGIIIGDKIEVLVAERLRGIKLPEIGVIPATARYSVLFVATLIALGQVGVATTALIVLLGAYAVALIVFTAIATQELLASGAVGVYLLLTEPYSIGDEVAVAGQRGIVQEIDLFVTRIDTDDEEHIIPNRTVLRDGIVRIH